MRTVLVEADKPSLAEDAITSLYYDGELVLDSDDMWDHNISADPEPVEEGELDYIVQKDKDEFFEINPVRRQN